MSQKEDSESKKTTDTPGSSQAPPKRSFMPNISVQRARKEVPKEEESKQPPGGRRPPQPNLNRAAQRGGRGGNRGGNNAANLIQSHSIFEAGPGVSVKRYGGDKEYYESTTRIAGSGAGSSGSSIKRENDSERPIKIEESLLIEDQKETDDSVYVSLKYDSKEVPFFDNQNSQVQIESLENSILREIFDPTSPDDKQRDKLLLFQIPETLGINEMGEGQIGKIRIRKSGKIEFCVNEDKILGVSLSVCGSFVQDATALELNDEQTGRLINLGHIENKIVVSQRIS